MDISDTLTAKSDQINAEDLLAGSITVKIVNVTRSNDDQPVAIEVDGGFKQPNGKWKVWRPCKTMRRLMVMAWPDCVKPPIAPGVKATIDPTVWIGRSVTLIRDPSVRWGKDVVGGTRIAALSHIPKQFEVALAESKGKKKLVTVERIDTPPGKKQADKPAEQPLQDNAARFKAMKDEWKIAQKAIGGHLTEAAFREFADTTTGGMVPAAKALEPANYTAEHLAACEAAAKAMMPAHGENF